MEFKSLILGLIMSMAAFAIKSGAGLGYAFSGSDLISRRVLIVTGFTSAYAGIFYLSTRILDIADLAVWFEQLETLLKSGMVIHMALAVLLGFWGIRLLIRTPVDRGRTKAWLVLAIPCPVCFSVILLNTGLVTALYPDRSDLVWWLFSGFILSSLFIAVAVLTLGRHLETENMLGTMMIYLAAYFMLCVTIIPHFGDIEAVYRLSSPIQPASVEFGFTVESATGISAAGIPGVTWLMIGTVMAFAAGFFNPFRKRN